MSKHWGYARWSGWWLGIFALSLVLYSCALVLVSPHSPQARTIWPNVDARFLSQAALAEASSPNATPPSQATSVRRRRSTHPAVSLPNTTQIGVYEGPGAIGGLNSFAGWLGRPVPYASDYIDYKGGWQKDFVDSKLWLEQRWGPWVSAQPSRRLVLGVPLLESSNTGQFNQGANGAFDGYFRQLAQQLVANHLGNSIIRLGYEANCNTIGPWQATDNPAGYKVMFRHVAGVLRSVPGSSFVIDWTACNGLQSGHALNSFNSFYPGNDVVDIIGLDIYDVKWQDTSVNPEQRWSYNYNRTMGIGAMIAYAHAHGKPLSYPEWGLYRPGDNYAGGGDDPYFIQRMHALVLATNPVYQSYFNLDWGSGILSDFPSGQAEFRALFGG